MVFPESSETIFTPQRAAAKRGSETCAPSRSCNSARVSGAFRSWALDECRLASAISTATEAKRRSRFRVPGLQKANLEPVSNFETTRGEGGEKAEPIERANTSA